MNPRLALLSVYVPRTLRKKLLLEFAGLASKVFGSPAPDVKGMSFVKILAGFAAYLAQNCGRVSVDKAESARVEKALYDAARAMGAKYRQELGIRSFAEAVAATRLFYRVLGIDFRRASNGDVTVSRCFFSGHFSPDICTLVSAMDQGAVAGLTGGRLEFSERITEGKACCKGVLSEKG